MPSNRIRVSKDKANLVRQLVDYKGTTGPFQTYADAIAFAAALGSKYRKRVPLDTISTSEPAPIATEIFISRGYDTTIKLLAIAETGNPKILSTFDPEKESERLQIFEEYANGGLEILQDELRGAVDYTERILLMLARERVKNRPDNEEEFDLTKFL